MEKALGQTLALDVPWDVFASQAIDEGTLLLLQHLPEGEPRSVLDLGCGYGALGLPVAMRWPEARCLLVDRDLLAVAASAHNARALGLGNVEVRPGLGYRELAGERFDWVLCNVPARIGSRVCRSTTWPARPVESGLAAPLSRCAGAGSKGADPSPMSSTKALRLRLEAIERVPLE